MLASSLSIFEGEQTYKNVFFFFIHPTVSIIIFIVIVTVILLRSKRESRKPWQINQVDRHPQKRAWKSCLLEAMTVIVE